MYFHSGMNLLWICKIICLSPVTYSCPILSNIFIKTARRSWKQQVKPFGYGNVEEWNFRNSSAQFIRGVIRSLNNILTANLKAGDWIPQNTSVPKFYPIYRKIAESIADGIKRGSKECRNQFKWDKWNCPSSAFSAVTYTTHAKATKENAFVQAIASAGVMYTLIKQCRTGYVSLCGCDYSRNGRRGGPYWKWGGCSDNAIFGESVSKHFIDSMKTRKDARAAIHTHNNAVGRKAVKRQMKIVCKCHGVSGSCSLRTCWRVLGAFRKSGEFLKRRYKRATLVDYRSEQYQNPNDASQPLPVNYSDKELLYLDESPDYCKPQKALGWKGTLYRECSRSKKGSTSKSERRSCNELCSNCGFRIRKKIAHATMKCNCKFRWCCEVHCQVCPKTVTRYYCQR